MEEISPGKYSWSYSFLIIFSYSRRFVLDIGRDGEEEKTQCPTAEEPNLLTNKAQEHAGHKADL